MAAAHSVPIYGPVHKEGCMALQSAYPCISGLGTINWDAIVGKKKTWTKFNFSGYFEPETEQ